MVTPRNAQSQRYRDPHGKTEAQRGSVFTKVTQHVTAQVTPEDRLRTSVYATIQFLPQGVRQWWAELPQGPPLQDHSNFQRQCSLSLWRVYQSLEPLGSQQTSYLGNGLPRSSSGGGSGYSAPSAAAKGSRGPAHPPSSPMGHWVHVPTADGPMVAPGAKKAQRWGTEQKQKPSRGARAG